jgi:hypothetical protein
VLEVAGVAYGPRPVPISTESLKKRKVDAAMKVSAKRPKVTERKGVGLVKVSGSRASGSSKWLSGADVPPAMSVKLSKGIVPRTIASTAVAHIMSETCAVGAKAGVKRSCHKTVLGAKAAPSARHRPGHQGSGCTILRGD